VDIKHVRTKKKKNIIDIIIDEIRGERCKDEMHNEKKDKVYDMFIKLFDQQFN